MSTEVDIANLALSHFGQVSSIDSIDPPDGSVEAEQAATFLPMVRDELLEAYAWRWASKRATLSAMTNDRTDWGYKYALPADCIKPRKLLPPSYDDEHGEGLAYDTEGEYLYADEQRVVLVYTARVTDPVKWSPLFRTTMSWRLASYMSGPIVKDPTGRTQAFLYQRSEVEFGRATASDANASTSRAEHMSTAKRARR